MIQHLKRFYKKYLGLNVNDSFSFSLLTNFWNPKNISNKWSVFINKYCSILAWNKSRIIFSSNILIWPWVVITSANHSIKKSDKLYDQIWHEEDVYIWDEVWIGANAVILPWVSLPKWTIVWANAVVTKSPEWEYTIIWGVPAKFLKNRPE